MIRWLLMYGIALAAAAFLLQWIEYQAAIRTYATDLYVLLVAVLFTGLGIWVGYRLTSRSRAGRFEKNTRALEALEADGVPADVLGKVGALISQKFDTEDALREAVAGRLSEAELDAHWAHIRERARKPYYRGMLVRDRNWNFLEDIAYEYVFSGFTHEDEQLVRIQDVEVDSVRLADAEP